MDDVTRLDEAIGIFGKCVVGFVCGGDGVCPVGWKVLKRLIGAASIFLDCGEKELQRLLFRERPRGKIEKESSVKPMASYPIRG